MASEVTLPILLLGDTVGKSTLFSRISLGPNAPLKSSLPILRDNEQPFVFNIHPKRDETRPLTQSGYRLEFYDTSYSEQSFTLLRPSLIILCYSVASRQSLASVRQKWKPLVDSHFNYHEHFPIILLGLQRDLRTNEREEGSPPAYSEYDTPTPEVTGGGIYSATMAAREDNQPQQRPYKCVMPQEGLNTAQEMRCDRYAECSAITGELCIEVFTDIVQSAVGTLKGAGLGRTQQNCTVM